jgi:hypothetical protein
MMTMRKEDVDKQKMSQILHDTITNKKETKMTPSTQKTSFSNARSHKCKLGGYGGPSSTNSMNQPSRHTPAFGGVVMQVLLAVQEQAGKICSAAHCVSMGARGGYRRRWMGWDGMYIIVSCQLIMREGRVMVTAHEGDMELLLRGR